jgi:hypothetical protein
LDATIGFAGKDLHRVYKLRREALPQKRRDAKGTSREKLFLNSGVFLCVSGILF